MCILCEASIINNIHGTSKNDVVYGQGAYAKLKLAKGNDFASITGTKNKLYGQDGHDKIMISGDKNVLLGGNGKDYLKANGDKNTLKGGNDNDKVYAYGDNNKLFGDRGNDKLYAKGDDNLLKGGHNNDKIITKGDSSVLKGQSGNDNIKAYGDAHLVTGNSGNDKIYILGNNAKAYAGSGNDKVTVKGKDASLSGDSGNDYLKAIGNGSRIDGGSGNDKIFSYGDNQVANGGSGDDRIVSNNSDSTLMGGSGNDVINAGGGDDTVIHSYAMNKNTKDVYNGGSGNDTLTLNFTYSDLKAAASKLGYTDAGNYVQALHDAFNSHTSGYLDFQNLGMNLKVKNFESLEIKVKGSPFTASNDSATVSEDSSTNTIDVLANDNANGNQATITAVNGKTLLWGQSMTLSGGAKITFNTDDTFNFDPNGAYNHLAQGQEATVTFTYTASYNNYSTVAKVTVKIQGKNDGPTAKNDSFSGSENKVLNGNLFSDNGNGKDSDIDGDTFSITQVNGSTLPSNGVISLNSGALLTVNKNGTFSFDANGKYDYLDNGQTATETFNYQITDAHGATSTAQATITINGFNANGIPQMNVSNATVAEADDGQHSYLTFNVTLSQAHSSPVSVDYTTSSGTASGIIDADFKLTQGTINFAAGETSKNIYVKVLGDNAYEAAETMNLSLLNANGAVIVDGDAIGTITNDDSQQSGSLDVPIFNSKADATKVLYLDFNGASVSNTAWNATKTGGQTINAPAFSSDSNTNSFSQTELNQIAEIWQRVQEDFLPFNVNVTTDIDVYNSTASSSRLATVITDDNSWYGQAGGVAYLNVWGQSSEYYQPAWVFSNMLGKGGSNHAKSVAEAISHEIGHNLGLYHDGTNSVGYYQGHGSGETGWAGIMGVGYYKNLTQWSKGEYGSANNQQDDLQYISSRLGYRADDHGDSKMDASLIHLGQGLAAEGIIEKNTDVDVFKFIGQGSNVTFNINNLNTGANLDILAVLKDANGQVIASSNPTNDLDASINVTLASNKEVYLEISGTGKGSPTSGGYSDYGSLGYYSVELA